MEKLTKSYFIRPTSSGAFWRVIRYFGDRASGVSVFTGTEAECAAYVKARTKPEPIPEAALAGVKP